MVEILYVKVIKPAGSLGKRFHRVSATLFGNVKDWPEPQVPCCELKTPQVPQCRWSTAGPPAFGDTSFLIVVSPWPCSGCT